MPGDYTFAPGRPLLERVERANPVEAKARELAWTRAANALIAELGVGSVAASALQIAFGVAAFAAALGATLVLLGVGIIWAGRRTS